MNILQAFELFDEKLTAALTEIQNSEPVNNIEFLAVVHVRDACKKVKEAIKETA